ncbi:MAG TPA: hypothetical protein VGM90_23420 [Kofleriaceae bacterium]
MRAAYALLLLAACGRVHFHHEDAGDVDAEVGETDVAPLYPVHGASWNDYVANTGGGGTAATRPDAACDPTTKSYFKCLHGGELRVFTTNETSCDGLTAHDDLNAFDWTCDATTSPARFISRGLADGKGLRDLVTADAWLPNKVTVLRDGTPIFVTPSSVWWTNSVMPLPANPAMDALPVALTSAGTIYTQASNAVTSGYSIQTDRIAVVTLGGSELAYSGYLQQWCGTDGSIGTSGYRSMICVGTSHFGWIETQLRGGPFMLVDMISLRQGVTFTRVHRSVAHADGMSQNGINVDPGAVMESTYSDLVDESGADGNTGIGITLGGETTNSAMMTSNASNNGEGFYLGLDELCKNVMAGNVAASNTGPGVEVHPTEQYFSIIQQTSFSNSSIGMGLSGNWGNYIAVTSVQNASDQFSYHQAGNPYKETFTNFALVGVANVAEGLFLESPNAATITDIFVANTSKGIDAIATALTFGGDILLGSNTMSCVNGGANVTLGANCAHGPSLTTPAITGVDPTQEFIGLVTTNDPANNSAQTNGTAAYPPNDWTTFSNRFRGWGHGAAMLFSASGACPPGQNCQMYDWRLRADAPTLLNHFGAFPMDGSCPAAVDARVTTNVLKNFDDPAPRKFLRSAIEILDPWVNPNGNYDGLCESNEACLYTPNIGAYQGSGDFTTRTCAFQSGNGIADVTIYAYPINGE